MLRNRSILGLAILATTVGCSSESGDGGSSDSQDVVDAAQSLELVQNTADFDHIWRVKGMITFFEGSTTLVTQNVDQPKLPLLKTPVTGGIGIGVGPFDVNVTLGDAFKPETMPKIGDCMAVKVDPGAEVLTDAQLRARPEFGAFVYVSDPLSGAPRRPVWGLREGSVKVYKTVAECKNDPERRLFSKSPTDKLTAVTGAGPTSVHLAGQIGDFEAQAVVALVNVSEGNEPLILEKGFQSGGYGDHPGKIDVTINLAEKSDTAPNAGDCIAVTNISSGRGFSDEEARGKEPFGVFRWSTSPNEPMRVFVTAEQCKAPQR
jgi:hypothetical protein